MRFDSNAGDASVIAEIGRRVARERLSRNVTQQELAARAGVGVATLQRLEHGRPSDLVSFVRVLRALERLADLEALLPDIETSPLEQLALHGRLRQRARPSRPTAEEVGEPWRWGDERADDVKK